MAAVRSGSQLCGGFRELPRGQKLRSLFRGGRCSTPGWLRAAWALRFVLGMQIRSASAAGGPRLHGNAFVVLPSCGACQSPYKIPTIQEWPGLFWQVPASLEAALRVTRIAQTCMTGPHPQRFRRHGQPRRLFWEEVPVERCLETLPIELLAMGHAIFEWLVGRNECYVAGLRKHREELAKGRGGEPLGMWVVLELGVEAWVWPLLYHNPELCESVEARQGHHMSAKRAFMYKCYWGILDYQKNMVLSAFQYDRALIAHFVGRATRGPGVATSVGSAGHPAAAAAHGAAPAKGGRYLPAAWGTILLCDFCAGGVCDPASHSRGKLARAEWRRSRARRCFGELGPSPPGARNCARLLGGPQP